MLDEKSDNPVPVHSGTSRRDLVAASLGSWLMFAAQARAADTASGSLRIGLIGCPQGVGNALTEGFSGAMDQLRMSVTHIWDVDAARASDYAKRHVIPNVVDQPGKMVNDIDGVLLCDQGLLPWHTEIVTPILEAGVPVWIDGPLVDSLANAHNLIDAARRGKTALAAATPEEFLPLTSFLKRNVLDLAPITGGMAVVNTAGRPENWWTGAEGVGFACGIFGTGASKVCRVAASTTEPNYSITLQYEELKEKRPVHVAVHGLSGGVDRVWARLYGLSGDGMVDRSHARYEDPGQEWLNSLLPAALAMQRMFVTKRSPQDYEYLIAKTRIYLAACKSAVTPGGRQVIVAELADDWELENVNPGYLPARIFG